ncbi:MAG: hypothetical protein ACRDWY_12255 [Actinomycetes bacterium]
MPPVPPSGIATLTEPRDELAVRRARDWRRGGLVALLVIVLAGLTGVLGVRSATTTSQAGPYTLSVRHAQVVRAGIAAPFHVRVESEDGFTGPVRLAVSAELFERFDFQNFYPNPSLETSTDEFVYYEFDPPPGNTFQLNLDARTAPDQNGSTAVYRVRLLDSSDRQLVTVSFRMWVAP